MIDITKKYRTRDGRPVRILAVGLAGACSVAAAITEKKLGENLAVFNENGRFINHSSDTNSDLVEVGPYDDFVIDEPVLALFSNGGPEWRKRHFAGVSESGQPLVFINGRTRWSSNGYRIDCDEVRRPTEEELETWFKRQEG